jgi:hypothetical protein
MKVIKNWGKMHPTEVDVPPTTVPNIIEGQPDIVVRPGYKAVVQADDEGNLWYNLTKDIPQKNGQWFIAVQDGDGFISCCERDPTMVSLFEYEIWQIETTIGRDAIFCHYWNGSDVVDQPLTPA